MSQNISENFFMEKIVQLWNRLPRQLVDSLSLEVFKKWLEVELNATIDKVKIRQRLDSVVLDIFSYINGSVISM